MVTRLCRYGWLLAALALPALGATPDLLIEADVEPARVQVQTEAVYRVRFLQGIDLRDLRISEPRAPLADFRPLDAGLVYETERAGVRYRVHERRYAVFPFASGTLEIGGVHAEGMVATPRGQVRRRIEAAPVRLAVLPVPADASVPATSPPPSKSLPPATFALVFAVIGTATLVWNRRARLCAAWRLRRACRSGQPRAVRDELLAWVKTTCPDRAASSLAALAERLSAADAVRALRDLEREIYGPAPDCVDARTLAATVRRVKVAFATRR